MSIVLLPALLLMQTTSAAAAAPQPDAAVSPDAATIVVTASRGPAAADRTSAAVTVLDKAAMERSQELTVGDLIARTAGVGLSRNGGFGTVTSVRIRGAEADQTVVVIDGVKLNDPSAVGGGFNFANLMIGDAARIEVLRGPQSILWGSQAIGGVVNIVSALPDRPLQSEMAIEGGSRETARGRAALGGRTGALAWRLGAQAFTTDGISARAGGTERDGYVNRTVTGRASLALADGLSAEVRGYLSYGRAEIDGFAGDTAEFGDDRQFVGYAGLNYDLFGGRLRSRIGFGRTQTDRDSFDPASNSQTFAATGRNRRIEYQGTLRLAAEWETVFGIEHEKSRFRSESSFGSAIGGSASLTGGYAQLSGRPVTGLTLNLGLRQDRHSRFGSTTLGSAGAAWALPGGTILRANYGEGFKAPSLYQLFSEFGNADLAPEHARGWEAGGEQSLAGGALTLGATYFERRTRNQIDFFSCFPAGSDPLCTDPRSNRPRFGFYDNIAQTRARGVEAIVAVRIGEHVILDANYSWTDAENRSPGVSFGRWLPRRPHHAANVSASYRLASGATIGGAIRRVGKSFDNASNSSRLDDFTLADLRSELPLSASLTLYGRVENLFDEDYRTTAGFGTLGRSVIIGVRGRY